jgi:hypothetical protein
MLIGTWADATWAIRFYQRHGFELVSPQEKNRIPSTYWTIPPRQIDARLKENRPRNGAFANIMKIGTLCDQANYIG